MSELEKAAREYADGLRSVDKKNTYDNIEVDSSRMVAFKRGAEWADKNPVSPWITVADKEPDEFKNVLLSAGSCPSTFVGHFNCEDFVVANTGQIVEYFRVLHWMPIPE